MIICHDIGGLGTASLIGRARCGGKDWLSAIGFHGWVDNLVDKEGRTENDMSSFLVVMLHLCSVGRWMR